MPGPRRATWKVLVLWIALIGFFLLVQYLLREPSGTGHHVRKRAQESGDFTMPAIFGVIALVGFGGAFWMQMLRGRANAESAVALKLFNNAEYAAAVDQFVELRRKYRRLRVVRATTSFNLATALMRNGEFDRTLATLSELDPWIARHAPTVKPTVAMELAMVHALRGDPAAAERWTAEAIARAKRVAPLLPLDGSVAFVQTVNALRREEIEAATRTLDAAWADLEATLVAVNLRPYRALRAFAAARSGTTSRPGGASDAAALAEARPGELAWLGVEWPEMRAFLGGGAAALGPQALR